MAPADAARPSRLRILMVAHAFPPTLGGVETHLADVSRALAARGHDVACLVGADYDADEHYEGIPVHRRAALAPSRLLSAADPGAIATAASRLVEAQQPDVVHLHNAHHFGPELAEAVFSAVSRGDRRRVAMLNSVHDHTGEHLRRDVIDLPWDRLLYVSDFMRRALPSERPSSTLLLGIDREPFARGSERHSALEALERPVIFHPARLLRWKGVEVGLRAFLRLRSSLGRGSLVLCMSEQIVGDAAEIATLRDELRATARSAGVDRHLHFRDFAREEIAAAYRASDLVWYPTLEDEPYGLVPLEAMAAGVPVVVTQSGGMTETVQPGVTALVVPKGDSTRLADAALSILREPTLRARLVAAGQRRVDRFDMRAFVRRLERIYRDCVAATCGRSGGRG